MFFRGRINWLIIAICSLKAILIGAKALNSGEQGANGLNDTHGFLTLLVPMLVPGNRMMPQSKTTMFWK